MRAIWSGQIAFGLVNVPVKLYGATQRTDVSFHQIHAEDGGRIRYQRRCEVCDQVIDFDDIERAYDDPGGQTVVITDDDLEQLPAEQKDEIEIVQFVPADQIDPIMLDTPYYLEPAGRATKAYVLLRKALDNTEQKAVVRFTLRSKTRLGVLRTRDDILVLQTMLWPEDLREPDIDKPSSKVSDKELDMAAKLIEQYSGDFDPDEYTNEYQEQLRQLIDAKLEEGESFDTAATFGDQETPDEDESGKVVSLLAALEGSLKKRRDADDTPPKKQKSA